MGSLLYLKVGLTNSPYKYLLRDDMWIEAADVFLKDSSIISGINPDSPLTVIINAGCKSLPALLNLKQVMSRQVQGIWSGRDELPVSLHMTQKRNLFHLLFSLRLKLKSIATTQFSLVLFCGNNPQMRILQWNWSAVTSFPKMRWINSARLQCKLIRLRIQMSLKAELLIKFNFLSVWTTTTTEAWNVHIVHWSKVSTTRNKYFFNQTVDVLKLFKL